MCEKNEDADWKPSKALRNAGLFTGAYVFLVVCLVTWQGRTLADFRTLPLNELGDLLAGVSAPLAFLWLVAAVLIQQNELEATRREFKANRKVTQQQAEEARKQAEFIGEQTELLRIESEERAQKRDDDFYYSQFAALIEELQELKGIVLEFYDPKVGTSQTRAFIPDGDASINGLRLGVAVLTNGLEAGIFMGVMRSYHLERARTLIEGIVEMRPRLSSLALVRMENHPFLEAKTEIEAVQELLRIREENAASMSPR